MSWSCSFCLIVIWRIVVLFLKSFQLAVSLFAFPNHSFNAHFMFMATKDLDAALCQKALLVRFAFGFAIGLSVVFWFHWHHIIPFELWIVCFLSVSCKFLGFLWYGSSPAWHHYQFSKNQNWNYTRNALKCEHILTRTTICRKICWTVQNDDDCNDYNMMFSLYADCLKLYSQHLWAMIE